jgi:hypothetical protein
VRQQARRLGQDQTAAGIGRHDPPADRLAGEVRVIGIDVEAKQREPKALLPGPGPVAGAGIAALLAEDRFDVVAEGPVEGFVLIGDGDLSRGGLIANLRSDRRRAVADRNGHSLLDADDLLVAARE